MIHERSTALERSMKYFTGGLKPVSRRQPHINPSFVLVQPRMNRPYITESLLMGCKESSKQTNKTNVSIIFMSY